MFSWNIPIKQEAGLLGYLSDIMSINVELRIVLKSARCTVYMLSLKTKTKTVDVGKTCGFLLSTVRFKIVATY